jgi:hypothetical protein
MRNGWAAVTYETNGQYKKGCKAGRCWLRLPGILYPNWLKAKNPNGWKD